MVTGVLVCVSSVVGAQSPDQRAAERVMGPHWKQVARAAGMIFTGRVLSIKRQAPTQGSPIPTVEVKFHVDRGIAGVGPGQIVTIREWAALWPMQRPMRGDRSMLFFFYPPSSAGLTSPVGGPLGQVSLDPAVNVTQGKLTNDRSRRMRPSLGPVEGPPTGIVQLERAIRAARAGKD